MARFTKTRARVGALARRLAEAAPFVGEKEPPIEPEYQEWRKLYADRERHYATFGDELEHDPDEETRLVSEFYQAGGSGYDPKRSRKWLYEHTAIPDFRGTCLDVGSADGFWSIILSEWYRVYGVEPAAGAVDVANAIRKRLSTKIAYRIEYFVGDALEVKDRYDVVFCRAPSFFNFPADGSFDESMLDWDRSNLRKVYEAEGHENADQLVREYPAAKGAEGYEYAYKFRWCLERMLAATRQYFVFIISTHPLVFGQFYGNTYAHDPEMIERVFSDYGSTSVKLAENYIVAEITDPHVPDPPPSENVSVPAGAGQAASGG